MHEALSPPSDRVGEGGVRSQVQALVGAPDGAHLGGREGIEDFVERGGVAVVSGGDQVLELLRGGRWLHGAGERGEKDYEGGDCEGGEEHCGSIDGAKKT